MDLCQKKQEHLNPDDPSDIGDAWIWRAIALPSHLRVITHLSHGRSEEEAITFLAAFKARTNGTPPLFTSDKLPAYGKALISNYSPPEPPPIKRKPGRPRKEPRRILDPELCYAQIDKRREQGQVVEVHRRIIFGAPEVIRSEEHTSELQSQSNLVCRLLLEKKKKSYRLTLPLSKSSTSTNTDTLLQLTC